MRSRDIVICLLLGLFAGSPVTGQPVTMDGPAEMLELITLTRDTPFDQALRVIQTFSSRAVVVPRNLTVPIGVDIDRQPWRQALDRIAGQNGLEVAERENYLELLPTAVREEGEQPELSDVSLDSREVNISAVFFQADREALRQVGIDWSTLRGGRVDVVAGWGSGEPASEEFSVGAHANINRSISVDILLKALESRSIGEIVANPQVKVRSGKTGRIQVGSDFSIFTKDFAGNLVPQFFSTGTILTVTPKIISEEEIDFVDLAVEAERSSLVDPIRNLVNRILATTSTLLKDGEQTAIGGLYGQEVTESRNGVPLLKDLPAWFFGLRYLFGFDSKRVSKTELVVLLQVNIVPSVRQRVERQVRDRGPFEIIRERRKAFEEMMKDYDPRTSPADTLESEVSP